MWCTLDLKFRFYVSLKNPNFILNQINKAFNRSSVCSLIKVHTGKPFAAERLFFSLIKSKNVKDYEVLPKLSFFKKIRHKILLKRRLFREN